LTNIEASLEQTSVQGRLIGHSLAMALPLQPADKGKRFTTRISNPPADTALLDTKPSHGLRRTQTAVSSPFMPKWTAAPEHGNVLLLERDPTQGE
jgi:hypothetical protein